MTNNRIFCTHIILLLCCTVPAGCASHLQQRKNAEGVHYYMRGQFAEALTRFEEARAEDPADANAFYNIGATWHHKARASRLPEHFSQAEMHYRLALSRNPNLTSAYRNLAVLYVDLGREKDAFDLLTSWVDRHPNNVEAKMELARLYKEYGYQHDAANLIASAYANDRTDFRVLRAYGFLLEKIGDPGQALVAYRESLQFNPHQEDLTHRVAYLETIKRNRITPPATLPGMSETLMASDPNAPSGL